MKTSTKRILSIGFSAMFFMATLVSYGALIRPTLTQISEKRSLLNSKENIFNNQKSAVSEVQNLISQFQSIAKLQETVSLAMPLGENATQAMNQWQAIVKATQVSVRSFSIKPKTLEPSKQPLIKKLGALDLNISVQGPYENLKNFMRAIETNVRVANVKTFSVSPVVGTDEIYTITLTLEMYYQS